MSTNNPKKTGGSDIFYTPEEEVRRILSHIPKKYKIWECACGDGHIVRALESEGYEVTGTDLTDGFDFLTPLFTPEFDMILTNPPYSLKDKFLKRCFEIGKPFALLLPIAALGEQERIRMYKQHGIEIALPPQRINFITPSGEGSGAWQFHAWFCWKLLPDKIVFLD